MKGYQKDDMTNRGGLSKSEVSQGRTPKMKSRMRIKMRKTTKKRKLAQDEEKEVDYEFLRQNNIQSIDWKTGILDSRGAMPSKTVADTKVAIQEMAEYSQKWHNRTSKSRSTETSDGLAAIQAQLNNLGREIKKVNEKYYVAQVGCEQCKGPHHTKDCPLKEEGKTLEEAYYMQFGRPFQGGGYRAAPRFYQRNNVNLLYQERRQSMEDTLRASVGVMPLSTYLNLGLGELAHTKLTVELADRTMKYPKGIAKNVLVGIGKFVFLVDFIILDMPEDIKVPLILGRPFLSTAHAKIDVYKRNITLRVREERIIFTSVKPASSLIKTVYMLSFRERVELDLEARLMGETLVLNRSLDTFFEDYIELNDLNEPFELRRNQGDDLMPTIKEGEVIEEFRTRDDELDAVIDDYPSYCDYDKKIHIDCAHNLKFSCMIGFEFTHANVFPLLYVNVMSKKFHNSIMKDKMVYKGNNVIGALMNVPIFVGTFSVVTDFAVLENMDAYRNEGMGDVIFGEPFLREVGINAKRFEVMITIYNDNDEVTYQMVRSHPRFKYHTNEQCNKIPPLLKVSEEDNMNGISHSYQKLKGFYKGVLNLGPDYI
ncbi:putative reverse transcriptase domain-containing protein [Tanacetum coccineum]|uniref:Reverse transcriptase domain-containing protein n=1 Tax=Tanacetum coccineum TaxID=301880 RepID=A0ABQ5FAH6_9ASTR